MNKFTKCMVAIAVSALVAGPVSAETYTTSKGSAKYSGNGCKAVKNKDQQVELTFDNFGLAGPSTGAWTSTIFDFGTVVDGEGTFIISKPGKTIDDAPNELTMALDNARYDNMQAALADFAATCKDFDGYNGDAQVTKFDAKFSKNGEKVSVKMQAEGNYTDTKAKDKKVSVKVDAKNMELVVVAPPA